MIDKGNAIDPKRNFTFNNKIRELNGKEFNEIVDLFKKRIKKWYIEPAEHLLSTSFHYDFIVMVINTIIIDLLSQYRYNLKKSNKKRFKRFLRDYIPEFDNRFIQNGEIRYYNFEEKEFISRPAQTFPGNYGVAFYEVFRNGIVHNAVILPYGGIGRDYSEIIYEEIWGQPDNKITLVINCKLLFEKLKEVFDKYITNLKDRDSDNDILRCNFKAKFYRDFGYMIEDPIIFSE
ncbi:MAG: hypothetical protein ACTSRI_13685 [Promethearchaeota archaeon]